MKFVDAKGFIQTHHRRWLSNPENGLLGLAVGRKDEGPIAGGGDFCLTAFVERKYSKSTLKNRGIVPFDLVTESIGFASAEIDVVEIGAPFRLLAYLGSDHASPPAVNMQKWFHALRCGIGISNPTDTYPKGLGAGTLGFFVEDQDGSQYLASCNHVIARENAGRPGEVVVQPGTLDMAGSDLSTYSSSVGISKRFGIATLIHHVTVNTSGGTNTVDAALAQLMDPIDRDLSSLGRVGYGASVAGMAQPYQQDDAGQIVGSKSVYKVGRSTGCTEGTVTNLAAVIDLPFAGGTATFVDQMAIRATADNTGQFAQAGDSGSAVFNDRLEIIGMLFAGGPRRSLANPISEVLQALSQGPPVRRLKLVT